MDPRKGNGSSIGTAILALALAATAALLAASALPILGSPTSVGDASSAASSHMAVADSDGLSAGVAISSFTADPSSLVLGGATYLNVTATGGVPPYSYWYQNLPYGGPSCRTHNVSSLLCHPGEVTKVTIEVTVNDSAGSFANASTNLTISSGYGNPPTILAVYIDPSPAKVNQKTEVIVNATTGSSTPTVNLGYAFFGLPPGCFSFNQSVLDCIPTQAGTYSVLVRVTDGFGDFSQSSMTMNVTGGASATNVPAVPLGGAVVYAMAIVVVLVLIGAALLFLRSRQRRGGPGAPRRWESSPPRPPRSDSPPK